MHALVHAFLQAHNSYTGQYKSELLKVKPTGVLVDSLLLEGGKKKQTHV